jgi:hypothetical protein
MTAPVCGNKKEEKLVFDSVGRKSEQKMIGQWKYKVSTSIESEVDTAVG